MPDLSEILRWLQNNWEGAIAGAAGIIAIMAAIAKFVPPVGKFLLRCTQAAYAGFAWALRGIAPHLKCLWSRAVVIAGNSEALVKMGRDGPDEGKAQAAFALALSGRLDEASRLHVGTAAYGVNAIHGPVKALAFLAGHHSIAAAVARDAIEGSVDEYNEDPEFLSRWRTERGLEVSLRMLVQDLEKAKVVSDRLEQLAERLGKEDTEALRLANTAYIRRRIFFEAPCALLPRLAPQLAVLMSWPEIERRWIVSQSSRSPQNPAAHAKP